jgi:hypothetical protein
MSYLGELRKKGREANPFFKMMGIEAVSFGDGKAELRMEVRPDMLNGAGWMQGGIYTALADCQRRSKSVQSWRNKTVHLLIPELKLRGCADAGHGGVLRVARFIQPRLEHK